MKRDMIKYSEQGRKHMTDRYDLSCSEAYKLRELVQKGQNGIWEAIITAYSCGFEAGIRQTKSQIRRAGA